MRTIIGMTARLALLVAVLLLGGIQIVYAATGGAYPVPATATPAVKAQIAAVKRRWDLPRQREAAALRMKLLKSVVNSPTSKAAAGAPMSMPMPGPGATPDYFGFTPNYAWSPPIRKFIDTLPSLGAANANNLGQYLPTAKPDTITYPGSDYYEIEVRQYSQKMHSDLPPTLLRGYVQANKGTDATGHNTLTPDPIHYLGPFIMATKDRPVRVKFINKLPTGSGGNLFLPVDKTMMGAGMGPLGMDTGGQPMNYAENRATIHLHGGRTVWISDGTPHQWTTPAGEDTPYPKGVSVKNVPDMPDPGDGSMTFFYSNQQSARLLWFHDHVYGITRLNVYAGEAAGYLLTDATEQRLIRQGTIPSDQIPLVIQDKTFVDASTVGKTDPTWNWGSTPGVAHTGDLWFPHVYMPNQNPYDPTGSNTMGRWDYGLWFWPQTTDISHGLVPNPYYDPVDAPWEPPVMPGVPATSAVMESFMDTPLINGTAYPKVTLKPKAYRFRILNAANDRSWNLQLYLADPTVRTSDGRRNTEVKMVPAGPTPGFPASWPVDGRDGGVPDPATVGPDFIQIGNEAGFLAAPTVVKNQPVTWNTNMKAFTWGNIADHALALAPAERADVVIDFSQYAGTTLLLYNDAPAAWPATDPRNDYYTNDPDNRDTGGTAPTKAGFGPNTRTLMQIKIEGTPAPEFDMTKLQDAWTSTTTTPGVFSESQDPIIVGQTAYDSTYATSFPTTWPTAGYAAINDFSMQFRTVAGETRTVDFNDKGMHDEMGGAYDDWGRMSGKLGTAVYQGNAQTQQFIPLSYVDPATENITDSMTPMSPVEGDGTQIWKITHNGVDTHPIHFHLFDVQVVNRVGWDNAVEWPDANEIGWKDTVRVSPLQDTIVALRPVAPRQPFGVPRSVRPLDPTMPLGTKLMGTGLDPATGNAITPPLLNTIADFAWEYMWHCHILSHEEMEMMRPITFEVTTTVPAIPVAAAKGQPGSPVDLAWIDATPSSDASSWGNPANEEGFRIQRSTVSTTGAELVPYSTVATALANATRFQDTTTQADTVYRYRVSAYNVSGAATSTLVEVAPAGVQNSYTMTPWASKDGTITPASPQTVPSGADCPTFTITADTGCRIVDVLVDGVSVGATNTVVLKNVQNNHAVWAVFGPELFQVAVTAGANGSITPLGATMAGASTIYAPLGLVRARASGGIPDAIHLVDRGSDAKFVILPKIGYEIVDVQVDGHSVGAVYTYTLADVDAAHTITATFAPLSFTIHTSVKGRGTISPKSALSVGYDGSATFKITPVSTYRITGVTVNGVSVGAVSSYTFSKIQSDGTIAVTFAPKLASKLSLSARAVAKPRYTSVSLTGALSPTALRGSVVYVLMWRSDLKRWTTIWHGPVSRFGGYAMTYKMLGGSTRSFRARFAGGKTYLPVISRTASVTVR